MTPFLLGSYITCEEYWAAPTALNTSNLVPGGTQVDQEGALAGIIGRASRFLDVVAKQPLYATSMIQNETARTDRQGYVILKARMDRVKSIDSFSYGPSFTQLTTYTPPINPAQYFIEENRVRFALGATGVVWRGSLAFLAQPRNGEVVVSWGFTGGWVTTRLAVAAAAGASTVTIENPTGLLPGLLVRIVDGAAQVNTQVAASYAPGATVVPLVAPLPAAQPAGAWFGEVPDDAKEGTILATSHYIKEQKGAGFTIASSGQGGKSQASTKDIGDELIQAEIMALRYERRAP
jgi:hypothetical protein